MIWMKHSKMNYLKSHGDQGVAVLAALKPILNKIPVIYVYTQIWH